MSKNLAEPSTQRFIAGHGYNIRNLTRRPNPSDLAEFETYPTFYNVDLFSDFLNSENSSFSTDQIRLVKIDPAVPGNAIRNNFDGTAFGGSTRTATDGDFMVVPIRIGPKGAWWGVNIGYKLGPDYGKIKFSWVGPALEQSGPSWQPPPAGTCGGNALESLLQMVDGDANPPTAAYVDYFETVDAYNASPSQAPGGIFSDFRITGNFDDRLTAFSTPPGGNTECYTRRWGDGGPGVYFLKISVDGKRAASSGYKIGLWALTISQFDDAVPPEL